MRINIRLKLFLIITTILVITTAVFMLLSSIILEKIIIEDYRNNIDRAFIKMKKNFNSSNDLQDFLRDNERGLRSFVTIFNDRGEILASTSPQLSREKRLPEDEYNNVTTLISEVDNEFIYTEHRAPDKSIPILAMIGVLKPDYNILVEKPLEIVDDMKEFGQTTILITITVVLLIGFIMAYIFARVFTNPIFKIRNKANDIKQLNFTTTLEIKNSDEIGELGATINEISTKLSETLHELERLSQTDKLTQVANRLKVDSFIEDEVYRAKERGKTFSIILLDIDKFKEVNDTFGHPVGDYVLKSIASIIKGHCRKVDLVGRWGGEEFIIILPDTSLDGALKTAENIRSLIESFEFKDVGTKTASFGVVEYDRNYSIKDIILKVDEALYTAKESGRNRVIQANSIDKLQV